MKRIQATILKEWHLIRRDIGGIALLFFMPVLLIVIMALVQDAPFKDYKNISYNALFLNQDNGRVANEIQQQLTHSKQFILHDSVDEKKISLERCKQLIRDGKYTLAIIIPEGISAEVVNSANAIANEMGKKFGMPATLPQRKTRTGQSLQLLFDPTAKPAFKMAVTNALEKLITKIQSDIILERISKLRETPADSNSFDLGKALQTISVQEISVAQNFAPAEKLNSVQHNVPAWAIFGIFFLTVIISESIIAERQSGSWTRIKLIPGSYSDILLGKMFFFISLGVLQFIFMLMIGVYVMPFFGLPSLFLSHPVLLLMVIVCIAACATCFGILIGTVFNTTKQALPFAALIIVILSAIGGIWVPLEVLPKAMQQISIVSPMRWSLDGINQLLLRDGGFNGIVKPCGILLLLSLASVFLAKLIESKRVI
jgi:ABC-2 type transport system permease protein